MVNKTASYTYYSDGLRSSKTIGSNTTKYYYDGDNVINETLNGNSYATNVMGVNGYISRKQNGTVGYLFKDNHGDVLAAYSSTSNRIADYTYDAWGNIRNQGTQSWGADNPLRPNGQYYDTESGMTYLRARYYDSSIRRFITEDPIKDGLNWYAYAGNNPVMFFDPSGLALEASDELEFCRLLMDLIQMKVDYANTGDISVTAGAESIKEKIMDLEIVKNNNGLNQLISEIIYGQDGSSLQEVSSLFKVIRYFGIKREYATSFLIPNEIEGVTYDELKKVFNDAVKEIDANSIYYVSDPLDINETQANKLLNTWLGNNKRLITSNTFRGNGRIAINVDIR